MFCISKKLGVFLLRIQPVQDSAGLGHQPVKLGDSTPWEARCLEP